MTNESLILERLDAIEAQLRPLAKSAQELRELKQDLTPLGNRAFQLMIEGLQEVEAGFQLEDLMFLVKRLMRNVRNFSFMLRQMENVIEFVTDIEPLLKSAIPIVIRYLDEMERKGVFRIIRSTLDVRAKIADAYTPEDIDRIGDGLVALLGLTEKLSDPSIISFLHRATDMLSEMDLESSKQAGPCTMASALFNREIREGLGVMIQLTKAMGMLKESTNDPVADLETAAR